MSTRHQGARLINQRINYFDGHRPPQYKIDNDYYTAIDAVSEYWSVVRHVPKIDIWARSTHGAAKVSHKINYQLIATHIGGEVVKVTVWKCSRRAHSEIRVGKRPNSLIERCWQCSSV